MHLILQMYVLTSIYNMHAFSPDISLFTTQLYRNYMALNVYFISNESKYPTYNLYMYISHSKIFSLQEKMLNI